MQNPTMFSFQNQVEKKWNKVFSLRIYRAMQRFSAMIMLQSVTCKGRQFHVSVTHYSEPEHKNKTGGSYTASATSRQTKRNHKLQRGNKASSMKTSLAKLLQTEDERIGVLLLPASSELGKLLDIWFWREISLMCFSSATFSMAKKGYGYTRFFVPFFIKRAWMAHLETPESALMCLGETFLMQSNYTLSCYCARYCHSVWPCVWHQTFFHNIYAPA